MSLKAKNYWEYSPESRPLWQSKFLREEYWIWRAGLTSDLKEMISALNQALALNPQNVQAQAGLQWAFAQQAQTAPVVTPSAV